MQIMNAAHLPDDPVALKELIVAFAANVAEQKIQIADQGILIEELTEQVRLLKALRFAKSSEMQEKPAQDEMQYSLFDEAEAFVDEAPEAEESAVVQVPAHSRKKKGRKAISLDLPREEVIIDVPEESKVCPCGCSKERIGEVVSEKLYIIPQRVCVKRFIRPKYACRHCEGTEDDGPTVCVAPMPPQFIERGIVTPGLLAYILANKFCDGLPFYRQSRMFDRFGVDISRSTMSSWALQAAERCEPLLELMREHMRAGSIINLDETPVQVLKEPGRKNTSKSFMWVARGGGKKPVILFRYEASRSGNVAKEIVGNFQGYLQTDGYAGYNSLGETEGITHVGCLVHVRRKFDQAMKAGSKNSKKGTAATVMNLIANIYKHEKQARVAELDPGAVLAMRNEKIRPIFEKIHALLMSSVNKVPPKGLLGRAITYALGQWRQVEAYMDNPQLTPDNNIVENAIRPFAIGRKNWLFSGSPRGARASATMYSLVETASANGWNPIDYLCQTFEGLATAKSPEDVKALLPWNMSKSESAEAGIAGAGAKRKV